MKADLDGAGAADQDPPTSTRSSAETEISRRQADLDAAGPGRDRPSWRRGQPGPHPGSGVARGDSRALLLAQADTIGEVVQIESGAGRAREADLESLLAPAGLAEATSARPVRLRSSASWAPPAAGARERRTVRVRVARAARVARGDASRRAPADGADRAGCACWLRSCIGGRTARPSWCIAFGRTDTAHRAPARAGADARSRRTRPRRRKSGPHAQGARSPRQRRDRVHQVDDPGEHVRVGLGMTPWPRLKTWPAGAGPRRGPPDLGLDRRPRREERGRVEVALQRPARPEARRPRPAAAGSRPRRRRPRPPPWRRAARRCRPRSGSAAPRSRRARRARPPECGCTYRGVVGQPAAPDPRVEELDRGRAGGHLRLQEGRR